MKFLIFNVCRLVAAISSFSTIAGTKHIALAVWDPSHSPNLIILSKFCRLFLKVIGLVAARTVVLRTPVLFPNWTVSKVSCKTSIIYLYWPIISFLFFDKKKSEYIEFIIYNCNFLVPKI